MPEGAPLGLQTLLTLTNRARTPHPDPPGSGGVNAALYGTRGEPTGKASRPVASNYSLESKLRIKIPFTS